MYTILGLTLLMATALNQLYQTLVPDISSIVLQAIAEIESSGEGWENNQIKIRFENHLFLSDCPQASNTFLVGNPSHYDHKVLTNEGLEWVHESQRTERIALNIAANICPTAAFAALSVGTYQLSLQHYKAIGFPFPSLMLSFVSESPERELEVLKRFLKLNPTLYQAMVNEDLDTIISIWNPYNEYWGIEFKKAFWRLKNAQID